MTDYANLPLKAQETVDQLREKELTSLYSVDVTHQYPCLAHEGKPCKCTPAVKLVEKVPGTRSLDEEHQRKIARLIESGGKQFTAGFDHEKTCSTHSGQDCDCAPVFRIRGETGVAAETLASAILDTTAAVNRQSLAVEALVAALNNQTAVLAEVLELPATVAFKRDQKGLIQSASVNKVK